MLVSPFHKDVGRHGNISQGPETNRKRSQSYGFVEKSGYMSDSIRRLHGIDALYGGVIALLERGYSSVGFGTICLHSRINILLEILRLTGNIHRTLGHTSICISIGHIRYSQRRGVPLRPGFGSGTDGESGGSEVSIGEVGNSGSDFMLNESE